MRIFRNRAPSFQRLWNKLPILSKHNLDCEWIASFYYQMALKTSASLFIFSCDIIGSKGKTENMQAVLEKESSAHIKRRSRDYRKRAEMWRLSGHAWTSEGTIASSNLEKKWKEKKMKLSFCFIEWFLCRCACNLSFLSFVIKYTKYQQLVQTKGAFVARMIVKRLKKLS